MKKISAAILITALATTFTVAAWADIIILKTGEKFETDRIYREDGRIRFFVNGLPVVIKKKEIERIIKNKPDRHRLEPSGKKREINGVLSEKQPVQEGPDFLPDKKNRLYEMSTQLSYGDPDFRGIRWGLKPSQIEGLEKIGTDPAYGGVDEFIIPGETMWIGGAKLEKIVYGFWRGRLYTITIWTAGFLEYETLKKEVIKRYGKGMQFNKDVEKIVWYDGTTDRLLEFDYQNTIGLFWMRCRKLDIEVKKRYDN